VLLRWLARLNMLDYGTILAHDDDHFFGTANLRLELRFRRISFHVGNILRRGSLGDLLLSGYSLFTRF
jgi:hypothetical protein